MHVGILLTRPQRAAPVLSEDCTDLAGHRHKLPRVSVSTFEMELGMDTKFPKPSAQTQQHTPDLSMRGEKASLEEMLLLYYSSSPFLVFHG